MHIVTWKSLSGKDIERHYSKLQDALDMSKYLRSQKIKFTHTFEE